MTPQQDAEIKKCKQLLADIGAHNYYEYREEQFKEHFLNYEGHCDLSEGLGLEIGTGLGSLLEFANTSQNYFSIDVLLSEYKNMLPYKVGRGHWDYDIDAESMSEVFPKDTFDWVVCWNAIEHTPDPAKMIAEIAKVLRPGGKLYLRLSFEDHPSFTTYMKWDQLTVCEYFTLHGPWFDHRWEKDIYAVDRTEHYAVFQRNKY